MASIGVFLEELLVGFLFELPDKRIGFRFDDRYRGMAIRPIVGQRFEDDLNKTWTGRVPAQLPAFFANLLPEGYLRSIIERSLDLNDDSDLELLLAAEEDLPGAVRLAHVDEVVGAVGELQPNVERPHAGEELGLRFSLAGAQLKFSALKDGDRFTIPAHNQAGDWIVKIAMAEYDGLAENELFVLEWARAIGLGVPECMLVRNEKLGDLRQYVPEGANGLAIRRYDRQQGRRVHQEDFNQVLGRHPRTDATERYEFTYEELALLVKAIAGPDAVLEFARRLAFVVASGNNDAHLKNWSLTYPDRVHPELAPLYDQVATVAWPRLDRKLALKFAGAREFGRVQSDSFRRLARIAGEDQDRVLEAVQQTLNASREAWPQVDRRGLRREHELAIREHWTRVPLLRENGELA